jgi:hypothetical protein
MTVLLPGVGLVLVAMKTLPVAQPSAVRLRVQSQCVSLLQHGYRITVKCVRNQKMKPFFRSVPWTGRREMSAAILRS